MNILLPKTYVHLNPTSDHVFFLAGPVRGGGDWQLECCKELERQLASPDFYVAIPYYHERLPKDHPLVAIRMKGKEDRFPRQLNWERYYLDTASVRGCIIFWLPAESKDDPRADGAYATDTRGEIGEWRGCLRYDPSLHVVVGGDEAFPSMSQIERNFKLAVKPSFPIYRTLKETVAAAIRHTNLKTRD